MIAKRVMSKRGQGFRKLAAYLLVVKGDTPPAAWTRAGLLQPERERATGKLAWARVTNCRTRDPGWATEEILATQDRNTRARADKAYHLVVSWPLGEVPSRGQMEAAEDRLVAALGFDGHQRISAAHRDRGHVHLHVAVNRIDPATFHAVHPFRDHFRMQAVCVELEAEHGFTRVAHSRDANEAARNREAARGQRQARGPGRVAPRAPGHEAFRRERAAALKARDVALKVLRARHADYARRLADWHAERLRQEGSLALRGHLRRDGFAHLAEQRRKDRAERMARERQEREAVLAAHPVPTWEDFRRLDGTQRHGTTADAGRDKPAERASARPAPYKPAYKRPEEHYR